MAALEDRDSSEALLYECAWALANMASSESRYTAAVMEAGAGPPLIRLMEHKRERVAQCSMWTLANIAGDSAPNRDALVQLGVVQAVSIALDDFHKDIKDIQRKVLVNMLNQSS